MSAPQTLISERLKEISKLKKGCLDGIGEDLAAMGFPDGWRNMPFWKL